MWNLTFSYREYNKSSLQMWAAFYHNTRRRIQKIVISTSCTRMFGNNKHAATVCTGIIQVHVQYSAEQVIRAEFPCLRPRQQSSSRPQQLGQWPYHLIQLAGLCSRYWPYSWNPEQEFSRP